MTTAQDQSTAQMSARRRVDAPPAAVFALLRDPARHHETEPTERLRPMPPRPTRP